MRCSPPFAMHGSRSLVNSSFSFVGVFGPFSCFARSSVVCSLQVTIKTNLLAEFVSFSTGFDVSTGAWALSVCQ